MSTVKLIKVGELAKSVGKTVRAIHLYEEMGLLQPAKRSSGGFRLYSEASVERTEWIIKLQAAGFTLGDIKNFISSFEDAPSSKLAASAARNVFQGRLDAIALQMKELKTLQSDLKEALKYLENCHGCRAPEGQLECGVCEQHGDTAVPPLFAGLRTEPEIDVAISELRKESNGR